MSEPMCPECCLTQPERAASGCPLVNQERCPYHDRPRADPKNLVERLLSGKPTPLEREAGEALASLADELRLAREDAARYRWLRGSDSEWSRLFADPIKWDGGGWVKLGSRWVREHLDSAIDEAIKEKP